MEKDYGKIVEYIVRKNGYSITELATKLSVNRRSIYNWFNQKDLRTDIIFKIGHIIRHDFSQEFPELFTTEDFKYNIRQPSQEQINLCSANNNENWKDKYIELLEKYNNILISNKNILISNKRVKNLQLKYHVIKLA
jgi:transcriptional regulator with XRE-family HTH domain